MSGLELAPAIFPLAIQGFQGISTLFKRYRRFLPQLDDAQQCLKMQRAIFEGEVEILLSHVADSSYLAQEMLGDPSHSLWNDDAMDKRLHEFLWGSTALCIETIEDIQSKLQRIEEASKRFDVATEDKCFPRQELVEQLKSRIQDLQALTSQAERRSRRQEVSHQAVARRGKPEFGKFRTIQRAACDLHKALVAACSKHIVHNVQLCLLPRVTREFTQVRFTVSFGGSQTQEALTTSRSLWLAIESVIKDTVTPIGEHPDDVPTGITISLKRQHSPDQLEIARKPRKRVQFAPPPSPTCQRLTLCESNRSSPDLELRGNLCSVLQRYLRQQRLAYNPCLGFLEVTADFKHLIYIDSPSSDANASMSLASLLASWHKRNVITGLSQYERVQLAKCLATAVLYYRASPWLKQSWRSEDIYFCRLDKHASPTLLASMSRIYKTPLYVNSSIRGPESEEEERCQTLDSSSSPSASFHLTRNPILFGLGTMLLELAFEAPFKSLQRPIDIRQGGREEFAEYFTATRLSKLVSTKMCKSYKDIVERCLHCDFGCGDDLSDPTLQERFYSQVVCELDQLEKKVRALYSSLE